VQSSKRRMRLHRLVGHEERDYARRVEPLTGLEPVTC
jgi:hypothetical protein